MKNSDDLTEVCKTILDYHDRGEMARDVIEKSVYTTDELLHELALYYVTASELGQLKKLGERVMKLDNEQINVASSVWLLGIVMLFIGVAFTDGAAYAMIVTGIALLISVFVVVTLRWSEEVFMKGKKVDKDGS